MIWDVCYSTKHTVPVYSIAIVDTMSLVSKLASRNKITDVALLLRGIFTRAFKETKLLATNNRRLKHQVTSSFR